MRIILAAVVAALVLPGISPRAAAEPNKTRVESLACIPKEAELVFQRYGEKSQWGNPSSEIYVADSRGDHMTQITHQRKLYNHFAVSPDRTMIAAGRLDHGDTNNDGIINPKDRKTLIVLDLENKQEWAPLPQADDACMGGVDWTPDGKYIVASMRFRGMADIYRLHPDGSGLENLTRNLGKLLGIPRPVFVSDVSTSFDGQWITFTCMTTRGALMRIVTMRIDGSAAHWVTDGGGPEARNAKSTWPCGDFDPEFSPDGQYVVFERTTAAAVLSQGYPSFDVMRIKIDGSDLLRLSPKGNKASHGIPDWTADNRIVFSEWNAAERWTGVVFVNPDGSNYHRVQKLKGCAWVKCIPNASQ
jgi:Tol biopolymer transport system component